MHNKKVRQNCTLKNKNENDIKTKVGPACSCKHWKLGRPTLKGTCSKHTLLSRVIISITPSNYMLTRQKLASLTIYKNVCDSKWAPKWATNLKGKKVVGVQLSVHSLLANWWNNIEYELLLYIDLMSDRLYMKVISRVIWNPKVHTLSHLNSLEHCKWHQTFLLTLPM